MYTNNTDLSELVHGKYKSSTHSFHPGPLPALLPEKNARGTNVSFGFPISKIVKQWLSSVFDRMENYDEFRNAIYLHKHDRGSGESCLDHYIIYANMVSTLNPPMSDLDLLSALTNHFEPRVEQCLVCNNMQSTEDALAFIANLQGLGDHGQNFRSPLLEFDRRDSVIPRITSDPANEFFG